MNKLMKAQNTLKTDISSINELLIELIFNENKSSYDIKKNINKASWKLNLSFIDLISLYKDAGKPVDELIELKELYNNISFFKFEDLNWKSLKKIIIRDYKQAFQLYCEYRYMETIDSVESDYFDIEEFNQTIFELQNLLMKLNNIYIYYIEGYNNKPKIFYEKQYSKAIENIFNNFRKVLVEEDELKYQNDLKCLRYLRDVLKVGAKVIDFYAILYILETLYFSDSKGTIICLIMCILSGEVAYRVVDSKVKRKSSVMLTKRLVKENDLKINN